MEAMGGRQRGPGHDVLALKENQHTLYDDGTLFWDAAKVTALAGMGHARGATGPLLRRAPHHNRGSQARRKRAGGASGSLWQVFRGDAK